MTDKERRALRYIATCIASIERTLAEDPTRHPEIPWRQVKDFRNVAAHGYDELFRGEVERICRDERPMLKRAVRAELEDAGRELPPT